MSQAIFLTKKRSDLFMNFLSLELNVLNRLSIPHARSFITLALSFNRFIPEIAIRFVISSLTLYIAAVTRGPILTLSSYISATSNFFRQSSLTLAFQCSIALRSGLKKIKLNLRNPIAMGTYLYGRLKMVAIFSYLMTSSMSLDR